MSKAEGVDDYRSGQDRNEDRAMTHTYAMMTNGDLWPMCEYGWNRSDGRAFSIFRGSPGTLGDCKICTANVIKGASPVTNPRGHKTKWI